MFHKDTNFNQPILHWSTAWQTSWYEYAIRSVATVSASFDCNAIWTCTEVCNLDIGPVQGSKPRHGASVNAEHSFARHPEDYGQNDWKHIRYEKKTDSCARREIAVVETPKCRWKKSPIFGFLSGFIFKNLSRDWAENDNDLKKAKVCAENGKKSGELRTKIVAQIHRIAWLCDQLIGLNKIMY